jgi:hypothetical protein
MIALRLLLGQIDQDHQQCQSASTAVRLQDKERELRSPVLPQDVIDNGRIFFVFLGYPQSDHTILGALMDAHPNMVIFHQYNPCVHSHLSNIQ